ncbi:occludin-like isoform X2 [Hippocampus comes]|uniref:occludin-like isoform X2 n=1 Tax=Hippocampus comes TaxID=109280 RepID=UPI00094E48E3|nr:PREDICTED: occludin-like isoform X2 [Hippocampus comes]
MYEPRHYDSPHLYSPPYSTTSRSFHPPRSVPSPQSQYGSYTFQPPADPHYMEETPQHFYQWFSPPGFVKTFHGATVLMSFLIFACVASTLVWDTNGFGYSVGGAGSVAGAGQGYYGGSYGYSSSYMTPQSAKAVMISIAAINFLISLGFLVGSFSRSRAMRGSCFYLTVFICDIILAVLQGIIDIIFVIGVNPMSQSSQSMLYNPILMMCHNIPDRPSLSGSIGAGFPGGFPMYNQYLYHYCFMDPEEAVALALGLMVVLALSLAAFYSWKTRSKICRHGKANIYWDKPLVMQSEGQNIEDWVNHVGEGRSTQEAPTVVISEKAASDLRGGNSTALYCQDTDLIYSDGNLNRDNSKHQEAEHPYQNSRPVVCSSSSGDADSGKKHALRVQRNHRDCASQEMAEYQNETAYTTGGDTANELDQDQDQHLFREYPEIISDQQRRQYRRDYDSSLARYKNLCKEMDDICDQIHKLSRELDSLDKNSIKYQGVADEYNRLKDLKRAPDYQAKKREGRELRQKLFHIKQLVKNFDQGLC